MAKNVDNEARRQQEMDNINEALRRMQMKANNEARRRMISANIQARDELNQERKRERFIAPTMHAYKLISSEMYINGTEPYYFIKYAVSIPIERSRECTSSAMTTEVAEDLYEYLEKFLPDEYTMEQLKEPEALKKYKTIMSDLSDKIFLSHDIEHGWIKVNIFTKAVYMIPDEIGDVSWFDEHDQAK